MLKYLHNSGIFSIFAVWKQPQDHTDEWSWRRPIFPPSLPARPGRSSSRCSSTTPPPLIWPVSPAAPSCRRKSPPSSPSSAHLEIGKKCLRVTRDGFGVSDGKPGVSGIPPKPPCEGGRGSCGQVSEPAKWVDWRFFTRPLLPPASFHYFIIS